MSELLTAITDLHKRMDERFDKVDEKFDSVNDRVGKVERDLVGVKTIGSVITGLAGFLGWDYIKLWLTQSTK